jgi:hypothetical protein
MMRALLVPALLVLSACASGKTDEPAPRSLEELCSDLLQEFQQDDAAAADTTAELVDWLEENLDAAPLGYPLYYGTLDPERVAHLEYAGDIDWSHTGGAIALVTVEGTLADYARIATEADQSFADSTYLRWERTITEGTAEGFLAGEPMGTYNEIEKSGPLGIVIPYPMQKDFIWFDGVLMARTHVLDEGWGDDGRNGIRGGFTVEVWYDRPDGGVGWINASWTDMVTVVDDVVSEEFLIEELIKGTHDYFDGTEAHANGWDLER